MSIILENQHIMAGPPELSACTQHVGSAPSIARTNDNGRGGLWMWHIPTTDQMLSIQRRKSNLLRWQIKLKGTEGILLNEVGQPFGTYQRFYNKERYSKNDSQHSNTSTQSTKHD